MNISLIEFVLYFFNISLQQYNSELKHQTEIYIAAAPRGRGRIFNGCAHIFRHNADNSTRKVIVFIQEHEVFTTTIALRSKCSFHSLLRTDIHERIHLKKNCNHRKGDSARHSTADVCLLFFVKFIHFSVVTAIYFVKCHSIFHILRYL